MTGIKHYCKLFIVNKCVCPLKNQFRDLCRHSFECEVKRNYRKRKNKND